MRAYFVALGVTSLVLGVPLWFAGDVGVGCSVSGSGSNAVLSNCGGAVDLLWIGGIIVAIGLIFVAASFIPEKR
jgi:hypothetical protein